MEEVHIKELRVYSYYLNFFWILNFSFPNFYLKYPQIIVKFWENKNEWIEWTKNDHFQERKPVGEQGLFFLGLHS